MLVTEVTLSRQTKLVLFWAAVAAALLFLWMVRSTLGPFIWAAMAAYLLNPPTTWLQRQMRVRRIWAVATVYLVLGILVTWAGLAFVPRIIAETRDLLRAAPALANRVEAYLLGNNTVQVLGLEVDLSNWTSDITRALGDFVAQLWQQALHAVVGLVEMLLQVLLFLFATFYFLLDADRIGRTVHDLIPVRYRGELLSLAQDIDSVLGRFVRGEFVLVVIMSTATYISLLLLQIPYALVLGILAGFLELIPIVGPISAATPAVIIALARPSPFGWPQPVHALVVAGVYFVLRHLEDYLVIPNVVGRVVEVHPLVAIFAVIAGGTIGGVLGMFLAVPAAAVLKIVARYVYLKLTM
jgi:predicted PurR-regulated permease PerM